MTLVEQLKQRQNDVLQEAEAKLDNGEQAIGVEGVYADLLRDLSRELSLNDVDTPAMIFKRFVANTRDEIDRSLRTGAASKVALDRLKREFGQHFASDTIADSDSRRRAFSEIVDKETRERGPRSGDEKRRILESEGIYSEADFWEIRKRLADGYSDDERLELLAHVTAECVESNR